MNTQRSLGHDLWLSGLAWQRRAKRALEPLGLTPTQFLVLDATIALFGGIDEGPSCNRIAKHVGLERMTVLTVVKALEERDLLERSPSFSVSWSVEPHEAGTALHAEAKRVMEATTEEFFRACDRKSLRAGLAGLVLER